MVTRTWRVYGRDGHRQRESFNPSYTDEFAPDRIIKVLNSDRTGTNDYTEVTITRNTAEECLAELEGQISDGIFENCKVGEVEEVLRISKINIRLETFCTHWNGSLYCVDICEDTEERSAWLYNADYGVKMLMWNESIKQSGRDEYLDIVFSNLPDYIEDYAKEYEEE